MGGEAGRHIGMGGKIDRFVYGLYGLAEEEIVMLESR
jgi:hypothetical protein